MATTPPLQLISTPQTPPTPLHGAAYDRTDRLPTRYSARISQRNIERESGIAPEAIKSSPRVKRQAASPGASRRPSQHSPPTSPQSTPKHKPSRRVQVISPTSPDVDLCPSNPSKVSKSRLQPFLSATTVMSEGMLPTPVKTPKKKTVPKINGTARVLFQDSTLEADELAPLSRRARKTKRYNGFSLEYDKGSRGQVQIFTDSRDKVPQLDTSESNPFVDGPFSDGISSSRRLAGTSKRRKVSGEKRVDPQVQEAINRDEGMVYVFRGKKVYRRFEDTGEEEEEINAKELGLVGPVKGHSTPMKPLKTLTRKSIKPTRLFQSEEQKLARRMEKVEEDLTDVEEPVSCSNEEGSLSKINDPGSEQTEIGTPNSRSLRSTGRAASHGEVLDKPKKVSPFDSWPRVKAGSRSSGTSAKGKKRTAFEAIDGDVETGSTPQSSEPKKTRT